MSKKEIKYEIDKVLDGFSDEALAELLAFLNELDSAKNGTINLSSSLSKILSQDKELLTILAQ